MNRSVVKMMISGVVPVGLLMLFLWFNSHDPIEALFMGLAKDFSFEEPLHPIALASFAKKTAAHASDPIDVELQYQGEEHSLEISQAALVNHILAVRRGLPQLATSVGSMVVEKSGPAKANVSMEVRALGQPPNADEYFLEIFDVQATLVRLEGEWRIVQVRVVDKRYSQ